MPASFKLDRQGVEEVPALLLYNNNTAAQLYKLCE